MTRGTGAIELQAGASLLPELTAHLERARREVAHLARWLGIPLPDLSVTAASDVAPRDFRLAAPGLFPGQWAGLPAGALLARDTLGRVTTVLGSGGVEIWDDEHVLIKDRLKPEAERQLPGATVSDAVDHALTLALTHLRRHAASIVEARVAAWLLSGLPGFVGAAVLEALPIPELVACLSRLLAENVPLVDFPDFALVVALPARVTWLAEAKPRLASAALQGFVAVGTARPGDADDARNLAARAVAVPRLLQRIAGDDALPVGTLPLGPEALPGDSRWILNLENVVAGFERTGRVLVVPAAHRVALWRHLAPRFPDLLVVSMHELPRGVSLRATRLTLPAATP